MQFNSSVLESYSNRTPFKNQPISFLLCDVCLKEQDDVSACLSLLNNPSVFALRGLPVWCVVPSNSSVRLCVLLLAVV